VKTTIVLPAAMTDDDYRQSRACYYDGSVEQLDTQIGRILDALDKERGWISDRNDRGTVSAGRKDRGDPRLGIFRQAGRLHLVGVQVVLAEDARIAARDIRHLVARAGQQTALGV
jgi:hypothetical protein